MASVSVVVLVVVVVVVVLVALVVVVIVVVVCMTLSDRAMHHGLSQCSSVTCCSIRAPFLLHQ